jgi:hypothetical protein
MRSLDSDDAPGQPPVLPLVAISIAVTGLAYLAWLLWSAVACLGSIDNPELTSFCESDAVDYPLYLLPSALLGTIAALMVRRWWPFLVGAAVTATPILLLVRTLYLPS